MRQPGRSGSTVNQQRLEAKKREFLRRYQFGDALFRYLQADQATVFRVEKGRQRGRWQVYVVLPQLMQDMFDIDLEILCLATEYTHIEPRILGELQDFIRSQPRVENELAILVSADASAERLARQRAGEIAILPLNAQDLQTPGYPTLRQALANMLSTVDHFNVTTPIREASAFFGRQQDISEVRQCLDKGQHVGIFGLRKAGKSSLLNRLQAVLQEKGWSVLALDLNEYLVPLPVLREQLFAASRMRSNGIICPSQHCDFSISH